MAYFWRGHYKKKLVSGIILFIIALPLHIFQRGGSTYNKNLDMYLIVHGQYVEFRCVDSNPSIRYQLSNNRTEKLNRLKVMAQQKQYEY